MSEKITQGHLQRKAILYVRQSTSYQVLNHKEGLQLQYAMRQRLTDIGFQQVDVIDEDLGSTASGIVRRSGFERLVAEVCLGKVGGVAARQVCRLARNNSEWHRLVELCRYVNTLLVDHESIYDPGNSNDRLLLGVKGNLSTYELDILRQRSLAATQQKASRGDLVINLPAGYVRGATAPMEKTPDVRVQQALESVFDKFLEVGSLRQTVLWYLEHDLRLPVNHKGDGQWRTEWQLPTTSMVSRILKNPINAGAYAYGKKKVIYKVGDGVVKKATRNKPPEEWDVFIAEHHEGYISQQTFDRIQGILKKNAASFQSTGAAKRGCALLGGLLRCARCGLKLRVSYSGEPRVQRYTCDREGVGSGKLTCLGFGGKGLDAAVAQQVLRVVKPGAIEAASLAATEAARRHEEVVEALRLDLEAARFTADHARRQYDAVDPSNRLVAGELERRWNDALAQVANTEQRIAEQQGMLDVEGRPDVGQMLELAKQLPQIWNDPDTDIRLKKRIVRAVIEEVVVDVDSEAAQIRAVVHWKGGLHTELSVQRRRRGEHNQATSKDTVDAVRVLAKVCSDGNIAQFLSRNGLRTGKGNPWTRVRVKSLRAWHQIPVYCRDRQVEEGWMTLGQAAEYVGVSSKTLRLAIERGEVEALHPVTDGPWVINREALDRPEVVERFARIRGDRDTPAGPSSADRNLTIQGT